MNSYYGTKSIFFCIFFTLTITTFAQNQLITESDSWKYFDQGNLESSSWKNLGFTETGWNIGNGEFGYGDGDENTIISYGSDPNNKYITTYFRKTININTSNIINCRIKLDDGAVVYLNGTEIYRLGLPNGTITPSTNADGTVDENSWYDFIVPANLVLSGQNTFAVEIHQVALNSSDMSFDFSASMPLPPMVSGIYINELMASNLKTISDNTGSNNDWFEVFNNTNSSYDLSNHYISDSKSNLLKFRFQNQPSVLTIPPNSYKLIWASGETIKGVDHTSWSLSKDGEFIGLTAPDGITVIDSLSFPKQRTDVSYGRLWENLDSLVYFSPSSPNLQNNNANAYLGYSESPTLSMEAGFYSAPFSTIISNPDPSSKIYFTLDSSDPKVENITPKNYEIKNLYPQEIGEPLYDIDYKSFKSQAYAGPIPILSSAEKPNYISNFSTLNNRYPYQPELITPKATVVRSSSQKNGYLPSEIQTKTYFITDSSESNSNLYTIPVFSLNTQEDNLYEYNFGISTPGAIYDNYFLQYGKELRVGNYYMTGNEWERDGNLEYFNNNTFVQSEKIGIRVHGKYARQFNKKSFRIYFDDLKKIFPNEQTKESSIVILKNPSPIDIPYHDLSMRINSHLNIPAQNSYPIVTFLNGEYWGIYNIMEYFDEKHLGKKYKENSDNFDVYKDGILEAGSDSAFNALNVFLQNTNFTSQANFDSLSAFIDFDSFIDLMVSEIYANNTDWPNNNTFLWRFHKKNSINAPKSDLDGRWKWILNDFDNTLINHSDNSLINDIFNATAFESLLIRKSLENPVFKKNFINRFADLLNTHYNVNRTNGLLTDLISEYLPELQKDYERWNFLSPNDWLYRANNVSTFLTNRINIQTNQIKELFELGNMYSLNVVSSDSSQGHIKINTIDIYNSTPGVGSNWNNWIGNYFGNVPITLLAKPNSGFKFQYWISDGQYYYDSLLTITPNTNQTFTAFFEELITSQNPFPVSFTLGDCPYKFNNWPSNSPKGTFPKNMAFGYYDTQDPILSTTLQGYVSGVYNFSSKTRINGLNGNGFSFINTNSSPENSGFPNGKLGSAILALNTLGLDSIKISWKARTVTAGTRKYALRLQYREGDLRPFQDFNPPIEYSGALVNNDSISFTSLKLPSEITNKAYIQLIWRYYYKGIGTSGSRDQLAIDDIFIDSHKSITTFSNDYNFDNKVNSYITVSSNFEGTNALFFTKSVILLPGTLVNNGNIIKIEAKTCD